MGRNKNDEVQVGGIGFHWGDAPEPQDNLNGKVEQSHRRGEGAHPNEGE